MRIESIRELRVLAHNNQDIYDILNDKSIGRRTAVDLISVTTGDVVSEKLVRTWREKSAAEAKPYVGSSEDFYIPQTETIEAWDDIPKTSAVVPTKKKPYTTITWFDIEPAKKVVKPSPKVRSDKTIVIMPDVQAPLHDDVLVDKFVQFLADYQPSEIGQVGDFTDSTEISRWVRGKKPEFAGDLQQGFDISMSILEKIREVFSGRMRIVRSNHDDRLELYLQGCAPGLMSLRSNTIEKQLELDKYDVEFIRDEVVELTPQARDPWIMAHGDEGSLNSIAGRTAFNLAKNKFGVNVVCGHTHRAGLTSESTGYNGKIRDTRYGLEVGHFMDLTKADYLKKKGVAANWQQAFGILHVHGSKVYPQLVPVDYDGNFSVEGKLY